MLSQQIAIKVIPLASRNSIEKVEGFDYDYKVKVTAPPVKGRANKEVIKLLAKHFKTKKGNISIIKGGKEQIKLVAISIEWIAHCS